MKQKETNYAATLETGRSSAEILILPDGRILAHNITPAMAAVLAEMDRENQEMRERAACTLSDDDHEIETGN